MATGKSRRLDKLAIGPDGLCRVCGRGPQAQAPSESPMTPEGLREHALWVCRTIGMMVRRGTLVAPADWRERVRTAAASLADAMDSEPSLPDGVSDITPGPGAGRRD